jgi:hypothetical protein
MKMITAHLLGQGIIMTDLNFTRALVLAALLTIYAANNNVNRKNEELAGYKSVISCLTRTVDKQEHMCAIVIREVIQVSEDFTD